MKNVVSLSEVFGTKYSHLGAVWIPALEEDPEKTIATVAVY